jgi:F-type H+-transporting ATPase subunit delta
MAENVTVARPYAEAVFSIALDGKSLDKWQNELLAMSEACSDPYFMAFLKNSSSANDAAECLIKLLDGIIDDEAKNFIRLLGSNGRFEVVPQIYALFKQMRDEHDKVLDAELVSARELGEAEINELKSKLASKYGCSVNLSTKIDPSLIGGAVLKIGDKVYDASVKTSLTRLSSTLR